MDGTIEFNDDCKIYSEFSNYFICNKGFTFNISDNIWVRTSQSAIETMRWLYEGCSDNNAKFALIIANESDPIKATLMSRLDYKIDSPWKEEIYNLACKCKEQEILQNTKYNEQYEEYMEKILKSKFSQDMRCKKILFSTNGYNLVYANKYDNIWGIGKDGKGQNKLGKLLVKLRNEIQDESNTNNTYDCSYPKTVKRRNRFMFDMEDWI